MVGACRHAPATFWSREALKLSCGQSASDLPCRRWRGVIPVRWRLTAAEPSPPVRESLVASAPRRDTLAVEGGSGQGVGRRGGDKNLSAPMAVGLRESSIPLTATVPSGESYVMPSRVLRRYRVAW